jgi:FtsH-binding integral membrane protein
MNPQDHNKTLSIIYGFLGVILAISAIIIFINLSSQERTSTQPQFNQPSPKDSFLQVMIPIFVLIAIILLSTAYGLFRKRRWARVATLILVGVFVWLFPLGTVLAAYSWWFMHSEGGKQIYLKPQS